MHLPSWRDLSDRDKAAAVYYLWLRSKIHGRVVHEAPIRYQDNPVLTAMTPAQACNHAHTLYPHTRALPSAEWQRLFRLGEPPTPSQEGTRDARTAA